MDLRCPSGRVLLYFPDDDGAFRFPGADKRGRYCQAVEALSSFLDEKSIERLVAWDHDRERHLAIYYDGKTSPVPPRFHPENILPDLRKREQGHLA
jgi:hypothetical protein